MSFMFNPHPYNEKSAVNRPLISDYVLKSLKKGSTAIVDELLKNSKYKESSYCSRCFFVELEILLIFMWVKNLLVVQGCIQKY